MPSTRSTIETHPQRQLIDELILGGKSRRQIAATVTPPVSKDALQRYIENHIKPAMRRALGATSRPKDKETLALVDHPIMQRLTERYEDTDKLIAKAKKSDDLSGTASLMRAEQGYMRLDAELAGLLDRHQSITMQIAVGVMSGESESDIASVTLEAVREG